MDISEHARICIEQAHHHYKDSAHVAKILQTHPNTVWETMRNPNYIIPSLYARKIVMASMGLITVTGKIQYEYKKREYKETGE